MLKGVSPLLSPDLMSVLMRMGHGDELVLADAFFPAETMGRRVVRADGHGITVLLDAILQFLPLDDFVASPAAVMVPVVPQSDDPPVWASYQSVMEQHEQRPIGVERLERFAFYERAKTAFAIVATGETAIYGNLLLKKGNVREVPRA